jgi:hypothetical protein
MPPAKNSRERHFHLQRTRNPQNYASDDFRGAAYAPAKPLPEQRYRYFFTVNAFLMYACNSGRTKDCAFASFGQFAESFHMAFNPF